MSKKEHTKHIIEIENKPYKALIENGIPVTHWDCNLTTYLPLEPEKILYLISHLTEVLNCLEELKEKVQVSEKAQVKLRKPRELPSVTKQVKESGFLEK